MFGAYVNGDYEMCIEYDKKIGSKTPKTWASKIASLSALGKTREKNEELQKFKDSYPEIEIENEIEKIHFQDVNVKNKFKELVIWFDDICLIFPNLLNIYLHVDIIYVVFLTKLIFEIHLMKEYHE